MKSIRAATVCIIARDTNRVLLVQRATSQWPSLWVNPGGRQEGAESAWEVAVRETQEEAGVDISACVPERASVHLEVQYALGSPVFKVESFCVVIPHECAPAPASNDEVSQACWFTKEEVEALPLAQGTRTVLEHFFLRHES